MDGGTLEHHGKSGNLRDGGFHAFSSAHLFISVTFIPESDQNWLCCLMQSTIHRADFFLLTLHMFTYTLLIQVCKNVRLAGYSAAKLDKK